ncbi:MAG: O-antigen/teichoic acid export membrane protein [Paraglaciecola sp.]|jgi:O-antigen/teichoic acid export membrane protein
MSELKSKVLHSLKWVAITKLIIQMFRWLSTFWVIRLLTPDDYAVVAISDMVAGYLVAFSTLGLGSLLVTKKSVNERFQREMLFLAYSVNAVLFVIQFWAAGYLADVYQNEAIEMVLKAGAFCYLFANLTLIPSSMMSRNMQHKEISLIEMYAGILSTITIISLAYMDYGYWALVLGFLTNELLKTVMFIRAYKAPMLPMIPRRRSLKLMKYCLSVSLSEVIFHSRDSIDIVLGGLFLSKKQLGIYSVGLQVSSMPLRKIAPPIRKVAFPALASIRNDSKRLFGYLTKIQRISFFITIPIFWGLSSTVDLILPDLLGEKWGDASMIIAIICLVMPFRFAEEMLHPILKGMQKGSEMMICNLSGLIIFGGCVFAGLQWGLSGLAVAWVVSAPAVYFFSSYIVSRLMKEKMSSFSNQWFFPVLAGATMLAVVDIIKQVMTPYDLPLVTFGICGVLGAGTYLIVIYLLQRSLLHELLAVRKA